MFVSLVFPVYVMNRVFELLAVGASCRYPDCLLSGPTVSSASWIPTSVQRSVHELNAWSLKTRLRLCYACRVDLYYALQCILPHIAREASLAMPRRSLAVPCVPLARREGVPAVLELP